MNVVLRSTPPPPSRCPRYLCPIGGMNGLFAKLSITELRARQGVCASKRGAAWLSPRGGASLHCSLDSCSCQQDWTLPASPRPTAHGPRTCCGLGAGECTTYHCYKGGAAEGEEGMDSLGCPLYSHPAQLTDNRNCVPCMECLKACPNRLVSLLPLQLHYCSDRCKGS